MKAPAIPPLDPDTYLPSTATIRALAREGWTVSVRVLPRKTKHVLELKLQNGPRGSYSRVRLEGAPTLNLIPQRSKVNAMWKALYESAREIFEGAPQP